MTTGIIRDLAFSPDGQLLATADNTNTVTLWDAATGNFMRQFRGHSRLVSHVAFSPDGRRLASSSWDSTAIVWDTATGREVAVLQGHMRSVLCAVFSPDGRRLATSSEDQTVRLWDAETGQEVLTFTAIPTSCPVSCSAPTAIGWSQQARMAPFSFERQARPPLGSSLWASRKPKGVSLPNLNF